MTFCCRVWQIPDVWGLLPCPEGSLAWFFCMFSGTRNGSGLSFRRIPFQHQTGVCQDPSASRLERIIWALKNSMLEIQTPKVGIGISWKTRNSIRDGILLPVPSQNFHQKYRDRPLDFEKKKRRWTFPSKQFTCLGFLQKEPEAWNTGLEYSTNVLGSMSKCIISINWTRTNILTGVLPKGDLFGVF